MPREVLREVSVRHPRGNHTKLGDVETRAKVRDDVGVV